MSRLVVRLPADLLRRFKAALAAEGLNAQDVVARWVLSWVEAYERDHGVARDSVAVGGGPR